MCVYNSKEVFNLATEKLPLFLHIKVHFMINSTFIIFSTFSIVKAVYLSYVLNIHILISAILAKIMKITFSFLECIKF